MTKRKWKQLELFPSWEKGNTVNPQYRRKNGALFWFDKTGKPTQKGLTVYNRHTLYKEPLKKIGEDYNIHNATVCYVIRKVKEYLTKHPTYAPF